MISHAPAGYQCPFCRNIEASASTHPLEIVALYDDVFVKMNPKWYPRNPGALLVVPRQHFENVYELPIALGAPLQQAIHDAAVALKTALDCEGVSTRQHNEPAGNQDVWHYHVHVFPRHAGDALYQSAEVYWPDASELREMANRVRAAWPPTPSTRT